MISQSQESPAGARRGSAVMLGRMLAASAVFWLGLLVVLLTG